MIGVITMQKTRLFSCAIALSVLSAASFAQVTERPIRAGVGQWVVQSVQPTNAQGELRIELRVWSGDVDLYARRGAPPTLSAFDARVTVGSTSRRPQTKSLTLTNFTSPKLTSDRWYFAAYSKSRSQLNMSHQLRMMPAQGTEKGAHPYPGGTGFRVWAPNAQTVNVAGNFNGWSTTASPMVNEGGGWWSLDHRNVVAGNQYKFVLRNGANTIWRNDPYARAVTNSVGNSIVLDHNAYAWQTNNFQTPNWNSAVIYQMHIGAFNDSPGGGPGTFASAIQRLNTLQQLGVNAIALLPTQEFAGDFSWGYNPSHQFAVESAYGGSNGLKQFVDQANARGIAVLADIVHNHYGPSDLDLWRFDGWFQGSGGGVYFYNDDRRITPWGDTRPDYGRGEVRQFIRDNQAEWLEKYRMSGIRWDSTVNIRNTNLGSNPDGWSLLQWINNEKNATQPWKINIAEDLQNDSWITRSTATGGAGFDSQWSNFVHTIRNAITPASDDNRNMFDVRDALNERFNGDMTDRIIYTESHDENANGKQRVTSTIDSANPSGYFAQKRSTLGAALVMTAPGIPMIFMGQEFLEDGWFADNDPLDWTKSTTFSGITTMYRDLISLRRNLGGRTNGLQGQGMNTFHVNNGAKVIAFHRFMNGGANDDVVVVANFRNQVWNNYRIGFPRPGNWSVVFNSDWNGYSSLFANTTTSNVNASGQAWDGFAQSGTLNIGPYSVVVFAKD